jgi:hypothetical protein
MPISIPELRQPSSGWGRGYLAPLQQLKTILSDGMQTTIMSDRRARGKLVENDEIFLKPTVPPV